jgi:hypothetical protein
MKTIQIKFIDYLFITTTINFRARGLKLNFNMIDSEIVRGRPVDRDRPFDRPCRMLIGIDVM